MQQSTLQQRADGFGAVSTAPGAGRKVLAALGIGVALLGAVFFREFRAAVEVWNASTAYGHCYLVLPMAAYLVWDRRAIFTKMAPRPEPVWAVLALPITAAWLVAERLGIMEGRQLAAIAGFELLFLVVLGWRLFWMLSGPLLYLFFLVPFGAFLTPALQRFTAIFSIVGLDVLGIPNYSDNFIIETPAGVFFVAEACAGLRFLIAAVAFGVFYALLNFRSPVRRLVFIGASIAVPIIANGFRALGIVVLGQILGSAEAAAADHIVYGWVFFSIVMLLLVVAGHPFREFAPAPVPAPANGAGSRVRSSGAFSGAAASVLLVAIGPALSAMIDRRAAEVVWAHPPSLALPLGCARVASAPGLASPVLRIAVRCDRRAFEIGFTLFPARSTASALVAERRRVTQEVGAEDVAVGRFERVREGAGNWTLVQTTDPNRVTAVASWVDGAPVRGGFAGRVAQARDSLLGADHAPVLVTISTPEPAQAPAAQRRATVDILRALVDAQPGLEAEMERLSRVSGSR